MSWRPRSAARPNRSISSPDRTRRPWPIRWPGPSPSPISSRSATRSSRAFRRTRPSIGPDSGVRDADGRIQPYLLRWHLRPKQTGRSQFALYLHRFLQPDETVLHDHPWPSASWLLFGEQNEVWKTGGGMAGPPSRHQLVPGNLVCRPAAHAHCLGATPGRRGHLDSGDDPVSRPGGGSATGGSGRRAGSCPRPSTSPGCRQSHREMPPERPAAGGAARHEKRRREPPRRGNRSLASAAEEAVRPLLRKRGFRESALIRHWHEIIGPQLAPPDGPREPRARGPDRSRRNPRSPPSSSTGAPW